MILKKLYENYNLDISKILYVEYKNLNLTFLEANILVYLLNSSYKKKTLSINKIAKNMEMENSKVSSICQSLVDKGFMSFYIEKNNQGISKEYLSFEGLFNILNSFLLNDCPNMNKEVNNLKETITLLEKTLDRKLFPNEVDEIKSIYQNNLYQHELIIQSISGLAKEKKVFTINLLLKYLKATTYETPALDEKTSKILDKLYGKIR